MKVAFDISQTGEAKAGCGYFAHALASGLPVVAPENDYYFLQSFGDFYFDANLSRRAATKIRNVQTGPHIHSYEETKRFWNAEGLEDSLGSPDIIHANNYWCPTQIKTSRLIYTLYDLNFMEQPDWTTEANRTGCLEGVFRASIEADWIVAISKYSRDHFIKYFPHFPEERIKVIYPASRFTSVDKVGTRPTVLKDIPAGQFWLSVGTIEPRKNQKMLIQAYASYLSLGGSPMPLIFAGGNGWKMDRFTDEIDSLGLSEQIILTGYVSDDELIWLYRNCYANLYPSFFEGFGLPVLEGMQFGAPTVAANSTSIPEITGDAAILISPENLEGWGQLMLQLSQDKTRKEQLRDKSIDRAKCFTWKSSASALLDVYQLAVNTSKYIARGQI